MLGDIMKEIETEFKEKTIAIDFDGVIHKYSKGFQGLYNIYDPPNEGTERALQDLKKIGYRLIIITSRPVEPIIDWLKKYKLEGYFEDITNIKHPAKFYIDDHAVRFEKNTFDPWIKTLNIIEKIENLNNNHFLVNSIGEGI